MDHTPSNSSTAATHLTSPVSRRSALQKLGAMGAGAAVLMAAQSGASAQDATPAASGGALMTQDVSLNQAQAAIAAAMAKATEQGTRMNIVILDAARKNPWQQALSPRLRGLSSQPPIQGVTVVYPVAPGEVVGDAPRDANLFAVELIKQARVPGLPFGFGSPTRTEPPPACARAYGPLPSKFCADAAKLTRL